MNLTAATASAERFILKIRRINGEYTFSLLLLFVVTIIVIGNRDDICTTDGRKIREKHPRRVAIGRVRGASVERAGGVGEGRRRRWKSARE